MHCLLFVCTFNPYKPNIICIITCCFPSDYLYIPLCIKYTFIFLILVLNCKHLALIKGPYGYPQLIRPTPTKDGKFHTVLLLLYLRDGSWRLMNTLTDSVMSVRSCTSKLGQGAL